MFQYKLYELCWEAEEHVVCLSWVVTPEEGVLCFVVAGLGACLFPSSRIEWLQSLKAIADLNYLLLNACS